MLIKMTFIRQNLKKKFKDTRISLTISQVFNTHTASDTVHMAAILKWNDINFSETLCIYICFLYFLLCLICWQNNKAELLIGLTNKKAYLKSKGLNFFYYLEVT